MAQRLVVAGASAGGVEALARLIGGLPADFAAPVVIVLHVPAHATTTLPQIIQRRSVLPVRLAQHGDVLEPGVVYVAPNDCHVLVRDGRLDVVLGPRENGHRPAIDPLFRSAATAYGPATVGVVLTGTLDDGTAGAVAIKQRGGIVVVQDPGEAAFGEMPRHVIEDGSPQAVLPLADIPAFLVKSLREPVPDAGEGVVADVSAIETEYAELDGAAIDRPGPPGRVSPFACPDCGGVLTQAPDDAVVRFRCRVGHAFSAETLRERQEETVEGALFSALRALEERADLSLRLARRYRRSELHKQADRAASDAEHDLRQAEVVRTLLRESPAAAPAAGDR